MSLDTDVQAVADTLADGRPVTIISHVDADGITGEAILFQAFERAGIPHRPSVFLRQLEPLMLRRVPRDESIKLFCDFGAGQQQLLEEQGFTSDEVVLIDHHVAQPGRTCYVQANGTDHGLSKLSAAGIAYLVAKCIDRSNADLAKLAIIGNVGDMMARETGRLVGPAGEIVDDGIASGNVERREKDLNIYGMSTRPVHVCLAYSDDPFIPGISNSPQGSLKFLSRLGIRLRNEQKQWLVWDDLSIGERRMITSALVQQLIACNGNIERLFSESYLFPGERERTPLRNAQEFATFLNACGRWARPEVGSRVCRGDRGVSYREAEHLLTNHRAVIRDLLQHILDHGVTELSGLQYIHVKNLYPDTIVGIGAGMALSRLNWRKPIMIMCSLPEDQGLTKVSMRTTEQMVRRGIDLQTALSAAAQEVGGAGGGHQIAAGAFIPAETELRFIAHVNRLLDEQNVTKSAGNS